MSDSFYYLLIGGVSSIVSRTCTSPLEIYRLQRQNSFIPGSNLILNAENIIMSPRPFEESNKKLFEA